jgi:hypothetical protein
MPFDCAVDIPPPHDDLSQAHMFYLVFGFLILVINLVAIVVFIWSLFSELQSGLLARVRWMAWTAPTNAKSSMSVFFNTLDLHCYFVL